MHKKDAIAIAKPYFESHPSVNDFHVTADEQAFENKTHAGNHAKTFKEKENQVVVSVNREDTVEASEVVVTPLILSVPDNALIAVDDVDNASLISTSEVQQMQKDAKNNHASDTEEIDADEVDADAESIDEKVDELAEENTDKAQKPAKVVMPKKAAPKKAAAKKEAAKKEAPYPAA